MAGPRDQRLGQRAVDHGWLTEAELAQALREQEIYRNQGKAVRLGDLLVARNLLTDDQLDELMGSRGAASGAQAIIADRKRRNMVHGVIGLAIVALIGVILFLLKDTLATWQGLGSDGDGGTDVAGNGERVRPKTPSGKTPGKGKGKSPGKGKGKGSGKGKAPSRRKGEAALEAVKAYATENPDDIDGIHKRLREVMETHPAVAGEARQWQKEIEAQREQQAETAYQACVQKGDELFAAGKVTEALGVFEEFPTGLRGTSWWGKVPEWPATLAQKARDRLGRAADEASPLLEAGRTKAAWERLQAVRPYERLASQSDTGRMLVDLVQGLRSRAEWLARAEAQKTLTAMLPDVLSAIGERDFAKARQTIDQRIQTEGNLMLAQEARFLQSDLRGCEWALRLVDGRLHALASYGAELTLRLGKAPRKGTLARVGDGPKAKVRFTTGSGEQLLDATQLSAEDLLTVARDKRVPPMPPAARYALGVLALAGDDWESARDLLADFRGPRGQTWFRHAEQTGNAQLESQMGGQLELAKKRLEGHDWKAARDICERLRQDVGWPVEGESGPRRTMADIWSRASTELLGIGDLLAGMVSVLPGDRVQVAYDWSDEDQLRDFRVAGGQPRTLGTKLHCAVGTATMHEVDFAGDVEVRFRGIGTAFGVVISARSGTDGYACWFGKDGQVQILRDGKVLGQGPFKPDSSRPYVCRVIRQGGHIQLDVDGREILGVDDQVPIAGRGGLGFLGGPGDSMYETVIITGSFDAKNVKSAVEAQRKARKPPSGTQKLQRGRSLDAWENVRGTWSFARDAIQGTGSDGYLSHGTASRWELKDYTVSVEARRTLKTTDVPVLVFPVYGKDVAWVFAKGRGYLSGLPTATFVPDAEDLSFKFKAVTVVVKKGVVRGFIGRALIFEARADGADGRCDVGGPTSGLGLGCRGGTVAFRNPVFKAAR